MHWLACLAAAALFACAPGAADARLYSGAPRLADRGPAGGGCNNWADGGRVTRAPAR